MSQHPSPGPGCFTAKYPSTVWVSKQCVLAPPYPLNVGNGADMTAHADSGVITSATGSFQNITGLTSEHDVGNAGTFGGTNDFSLQVNTNHFTTSTPNASYNHNGASTNPCTGSSGPCNGWQQFVLTNFASVSPIGTNVYIQFWLLNYQQQNGTCPSSQIPGGWESGLLGQWRQSNGSCFINSPAQSVSIPVQSITSLSQLMLTGSVGVNGLDVAMLFIQTQPGQGQLFTAQLPTNFLGLNQSLTTFQLGSADHWSDAEFNVLGLWNSSQANFNTGTTITVVNSLSGQGGIGPGGIVIPASCQAGGFTAETNNLNLSCPCFPNGGQIFFTESNATSPVCACPSYSTWNQSASSCACNVGGQVIDSGTGQCGCPVSGQIVQNNQCVCAASGAVPISGSCGCSVPGQTIQNNVCNCSVAGAAVINGACGCFPGETLVNNACMCPAGTTMNAASHACVCNAPGQVFTDGKCVIPKNACGGTAVFSVAPGESCGSSCGRYMCNGPNAIKCQTFTNVCGGCSALLTVPGEGPQPGETCACSNGAKGHNYCTVSKQLSCDCAP